ncbi:MAG: hypothetical protein RLZZ385_2651 [Pseudomonadota bacterium]|jgi:uncharacterized protein YbaP (TraB family)
MVPLQSVKNPKVLAMISACNAVWMRLSRWIGAWPVILGLVTFPAVALGDSAVWVASSGDSRVFLAGTVHLLRPSDYPLPEEFEQAYQQSDRLYFETDISAMNDMAVQAGMLQQLMYSDARSLRTVLNQEALDALDDYLGSTGMPLMMVEKFKPGLLVSTLQVLEFQKMGFTPQGVDMHFHNRALGDAKPTGELESVQAQIDYLASMGEGNESEFILLSLKDMAEVSSIMDELIAAWREGDNRKLAEMFVDDMKSQSPALYDSLLVERNNNWISIIERMFSDPGTEFVLVGAAHLVGEDGLLSLLEEKGYRIQQL